MIDQIFTIYDEKAEAHLPPFYFHRAEQAIRTFSDCVNSEEHQFSKHPSHYTLFHHGGFENDNASFILFAGPKPLGNGVEYIQSPDWQLTEAQNEEKQIGDATPLRHNTTGRNP